MVPTLVGGFAFEIKLFVHLILLPISFLLIPLAVDLVVWIVDDVYGLWYPLSNRFSFDFLIYTSDLESTVQAFNSLPVCLVVNAV